MWGPLVASLYACSVYASPPIDRRALVARYNPTRNASSSTTPMQIGNGNFAFGADITGWKNDSLPAGKTIQAWRTTGVLVQYMFNGAAPMQQWMISNPNRVNLGAVGLVFWSQDGSAILNVTESDLTAVKQELDLWSGTLTSNFVFEGTAVQTVDSIGVTVSSALLNSGRLGVFVDFPWNDGLLKFSDPFVGSWNNASIHTTTLDATPRGTIGAEIAHTLVNSTFITSIGGDPFTIARDSPAAHRYTYPPVCPAPAHSPCLRVGTWEDYWTKTGFVDVFTGSTDPRADELQRRIILSRYLMRVNEAGDYPPQESGLVNNGWYGKFHLEMYFWHSQHWALWNNWDLLLRSSSTSIARAQVQEGWPTGARWGKMSDPSGRSAPGQINELLIWQQPHPLVFANYEYRAFPYHRDAAQMGARRAPHRRLDGDVRVVQRDDGRVRPGPADVRGRGGQRRTPTRSTPRSSSSYWRLGLGFAESWLEKLGEPVPSNWTTVKNGLAKLPVDNGTYKVYEDVNDDFWTDRTYINDHPALAGLNGWLPPTEGLDLETSRLTTEKVWASWNVSNLWGWDFPLLAMSAARIGEQEQAVEFLLHPLFRFDDVGMPIGGVRWVLFFFWLTLAGSQRRTSPDPGALLYAVALMAHGWDGSNGTAPGFPAEGWNVRAEGLSKAM
ncbi:Six-hairpin glycosidase-like protein [Mycena olivaceomarginata]|nr:Six-hairpin glycosidase-like protein [Mycena olivaceomarginata]